MKLKNWDTELFKNGASPCYENGEPCEVHIWSNGDIISMDIRNGIIKCHYNDGYVVIGDPKYNLKLLPTKKTGWVNIHNHKHYVCAIVDSQIFDSEEAALISNNPDRIATIQIEWEE